MNTQNSDQLLTELYIREMDFSEPIKNDKLKLFLQNPYQLNSINYPYGEFNLYVNKQDYNNFKVLKENVDSDFIYIPFPKDMLENITRKQALKAVLLDGFYFKGSLINYERVNFEELWDLFVFCSLDNEYSNYLASLSSAFLIKEYNYLAEVRFSFVLSVLANS